jgi:hypothetical protein
MCHYVQYISNSKNRGRLIEPAAVYQDPVEI